MEISITRGDITRTPAGAVIISCTDETDKLKGELAAVDRLLNGEIARLIEQGEIKGKLNEATLINTLGKLPAARVAVVGLGKPAELNPDKLRGVAAATGQLLRRKGVTIVATTALGAGVNGIRPEQAAQAIAEGATLGLYTFRQHITRPPEHGEVKGITIVTDDGATLPALETGMARGKVLAEMTNLARDMTNEPGNYMTPTRMAEIAIDLARRYGLEVQVMEKDEAQKLGMGAFLGVAHGSQQPPKFIVLKYKGNGDNQIDVALVGKGITFDSGGISIKPSEGMGDMKGDMAGGAAVMTAIAAIAQLKPKVNVVAICAATENMPSGSALKPGDILTAMSGKTIEIISTDAEGRLTLADALAYANRLGAKEIIDVATLTGAVRIALGDVVTGTFGNNQALIERVIAAGSEAGELMWSMPMYEPYKEQNKSDVADIKNTGGRYGGAITAAQFLAEFAGDTPWVHLDIAGTSMLEKERGYLVKGATGVPVRTLINLILRMAKG